MRIMMPGMKKRTTLTLDMDVAAQLEAEVHRQRKPFRTVVNEAIRRGLSPAASYRQKKLPPYRVKVHKGGFMPGIDPLHLNRLADQLEDAAILAKFRKGK
jgi:hypothetical protein